jgi:hypothetical protein
MNASLIETAIQRALLWVAKRGKGVSKHISHHTHPAVNAFKRNPRYLARVQGRSPHTIFRDPRPKKLIEAALRSPDKKLLHKGVVWVEKQFNRAIGKEGESIIRVWIDSRTGRIITAFPAQTFAATVAAIPGGAFGEVLDEHVATTIQGLEVISTQWHLSHRKPKEEIATEIIEFLLGASGLDSDVAGDPDEGLRVKLNNYLDQQAWAMIGDLQRAADHPIPHDSRKALRQQFIDAVARTFLDPDKED